VRSGVAHFQAPMPDALWTDLQSEGLIDPRAPVPGLHIEAAAQ
jgi:hypothetical protein